MSDYDKEKWDEIRKNAFSKSCNPDWPNDVKAISVKGLTLFGLDKELNLYWDGKLIEIKKPLILTGWQKFWALTPIIIGCLVGIQELAGAKCFIAIFGYQCN